jgi:phosphoglycerol transferase MdoB-like AlkP superfamily enzyme
VNDEQLYRFILETVDDESPSFNLVLTTTNHPPYDIDVYGMGFPLREVPPELAEDFEGGNTDLLMLGHHWYSDRAVGEFADGVMKRLPRSLIAITGDHWSRRFPGPRPGLYHASSVPLVLYGPEVLEGVEVPGELAGSHLDIGPTLVELAAPAGFRYFTIGRDILDPGMPALGFGRHRVIGPGFILGTRPGEGQGPIPEHSLPADPPDRERLLRLHSAVQGVSWYRIKQGASLP